MDHKKLSNMDRKKLSNMDRKKLSNIVCAALSVVILVTGMVFTVNPDLDLQDAILGLVRLPHSTFSYIMNRGDSEKDDPEEYIRVLEDEEGSENSADSADAADPEGAGQGLIQVATGKKPSPSRKKASQTALDTFDPNQNSKPGDNGAQGSMSGNNSSQTSGSQDGSGEGKPQDTATNETKPQQQVGGGASRKPGKVNYLPVNRLG